MSRPAASKREWAAWVAVDSGLALWCQVVQVRAGRVLTPAAVARLRRAAVRVIAAQGGRPVEPLAGERLDPALALAALAQLVREALASGADHAAVVSTINDTLEQAARPSGGV